MKSIHPFAYILIGIVFYLIVIPLCLVGVFCKQFNWKNIKSVYYYIFNDETNSD